MFRVQVAAATARDAHVIKVKYGFIDDCAAACGKRDGMLPPRDDLPSAT
jgi:hypothetical protein